MRKPKKSEIEFIDKHLKGLEKELTKIKSYLDTNDWTTISDDNKRQRESKFQADLFDKYYAWVKKYTELSGIVEYYNKHNVDNTKEYRKGFRDNKVQKILGDKSQIDDLINELEKENDE